MEALQKENRGDIFDFGMLKAMHKKRIVRKKRADFEPVKSPNEGRMYEGLLWRKNAMAVMLSGGFSSACFILSYVIAHLKGKDISFYGGVSMSPTIYGWMFPMLLFSFGAFVYGILTLIEVKIFEKNAVEDKGVVVGYTHREEGVSSSGSRGCLVVATKRVMGKRKYVLVNTYSEDVGKDFPLDSIIVFKGHAGLYFA